MELTRRPRLLAPYGLTVKDPRLISPILPFTNGQRIRANQFPERLLPISRSTDGAKCIVAAIS